jgi:hypothetical protein
MHNNFCCGLAVTFHGDPEPDASSTVFSQIKYLKVMMQRGVPCHKILTNSERKVFLLQG